ncbi:MAG: hypothetical protein AABY14_01735 [Nanoarchaeota archaeon]
MPKLIAKDTPLAELTLRRYEKPNNLSKRELIRKLCLSIGLLQPGDSRDVVVDVFSVLLNNKREMSADEIVKEVIEHRKKHNLALKGIAPSNVRSQIKRLRHLFLIEKVANNYRIYENSKLTEIFEEKIEKYYLRNIIERVKEYFRAMEELMNKYS